MIHEISLIVLVVSVGLVFHSYVLYPILLRLFSIGKKENDIIYSPNEDSLPQVFVIFSVYNEEKVIAEKLQSILATNYPVGKLNIYVGSDNSIDKTNEIIDEFAKIYHAITFVKYEERNGKANVLNKLVKLVEEEEKNRENDVYIFTDANVMFADNTIYELAKHFKNERIAQVSANVLNKGVKRDGISFQEKKYITRENNIKYLEGLNWGTMMGAFGACYALRASYWTTIPKNFLMEDFYLSMNVLSQNKKAISEPKAVCYEDVSNDWEEEFKRKSRIQAGNFQNLGVYWQLLFHFDAVSFCFFSHKVLRWMGPLFIVAAYYCNAVLLIQSLGPSPTTKAVFYLDLFALQSVLLITPIIDAVFKRIGIHLVFLRFVSYFYMMNLALVRGFIMYVSGVKTSAWNPTKRNI